MFFFFSSRRRHTRLQGDWSSDVCSSDLKSAHRRVSSIRGEGCCRASPASAAWDGMGTRKRGCKDSRTLFWLTASHSWVARGPIPRSTGRSEEHTSELQSPCNLVCRLLLEKKKQIKRNNPPMPQAA